MFLLFKGSEPGREIRELVTSAAAYYGTMFLAIENTSS